MEEIKFTKMHGISNDYIYINCMSGVPDNLSALSTEMSNRHTGVGGDGIILICPSNTSDFKMRIFNADGSEAEMCGNGSRCVGKYVYDKGLTDKTDITLETLAGTKRLHLNLKGSKVDTVRVDMGEPIIAPGLIPVKHEGTRMVDTEVKTSHGSVKITAVSMGNPHGVIFVDDLEHIDMPTIGPELAMNPIWPDRANIEFAKIINRNEISMRVWERGSGETMACGTGACATVVASVINGMTDREATVHLKGGDLRIEWDKADNHVYMTGAAETVFEGSYKRRISD